LLAAAAPAFAQAPAKQADSLNEQGKALLNAKPMRAAEATAKFRAAIVLSPEGRFYLNLCMALYQEGKLGEALTACNAVASKGATETQAKQAGVIVDKFITPKMREAGIDPTTNTGTTDPDNGATDPDNGTTDPDNGTTDPDNGTTDPDNTKPNASNVVVAPPPSLFTQVVEAPSHEYALTLGAQLFGTTTNLGTEGEWATSAGGLRVYSDYMLSKPRLLGVQAYITLFPVAATENNFDHPDEVITVADIGAALYKEVCKGRWCVKPLAGLQFAALLPSDGDAANVISTFGVRAELGLEYALGPKYENVLSLGLGVNAYAAASGSDGTFDASYWGLDKGSGGGYLALGFTRRFASAIGSAPLFRMQ